MIHLYDASYSFAGFINICKMTSQKLDCTSKMLTEEKLKKSKERKKNTGLSIDSNGINAIKITIWSSAISKLQKYFFNWNCNSITYFWLYNHNIMVFTCLAAQQIDILKTKWRHNPESLDNVRRFITFILFYIWVFERHLPDKSV